MVSGKPYISTNSATINAEKALKLRQSRLVCGLKKLKAKIKNTAELRITNDQSPYAASCAACISTLHPDGYSLLADQVKKAPTHDDDGRGA